MVEYYHNQRFFPTPHLCILLVEYHLELVDYLIAPHKYKLFLPLYHLLIIPWWCWLHSGRRWWAFLPHCPHASSSPASGPRVHTFDRTFKCQYIYKEAWSLRHGCVDKPFLMYHILGHALQPVPHWGHSGYAPAPQKDKHCDFIYMWNLKIWT